jgi:general stress protein YciG
MISLRAAVQLKGGETMPVSGKRGFGSMDEAKQREIASKGGQAAHQKGSAHEFSAEEARSAGSKGGKAAHEKGSAHEFSSEEARAAGRKGGEASSQDRNRMAAIGREGGRR